MKGQLAVFKAKLPHGKTSHHSSLSPRLQSFVFSAYCVAFFTSSFLIDAASAQAAASTAAVSQVSTPSEATPENGTPKIPAKQESSSDEASTCDAYWSYLSLEDELFPWTDHLDDESFNSQVLLRPNSIGSLSFGLPNRGMQWNALSLEAIPGIEIVEEARSYGQAETILGIYQAVSRVNLNDPPSHDLKIGHISSRYGGYLSPHRSHQNGRDVDVGFYYRGEGAWYIPATRKNLDVEHTWLLLLGFLEQEEVEFVFLDRSVQFLLENYAKEIGYDETRLHEWFHGPQGWRSAKVRHVYGHRTHMHIRFHAYRSVERAERSWQSFDQLHLLPHPPVGKELARPLLPHAPPKSSQKKRRK